MINIFKTVKNKNGGGGSYNLAFALGGEVYGFTI